jgi:hypothetical protein
MSEVDVTNLPAPLLLTLEQASKVAAGSSGSVLSATETWWWKGQPAYSYLNLANAVVTPANAAVGQIVVGQ